MKPFAATAICFFFLLCGVVHAASDTFTVRTLYGDDLMPPSIPANLSAIPVATSQIDLSWDPSSDDFVMGGYQVYRDAVQIATTTQTTFSDTGLAASTTYAYFVKAFDSAYNYSSSSNTVATTTLAPTPTSTPTSTATSSKNQPGGSGPGNVRLESFIITPALTSALFSWETNRYAQFELRWGRTNSYEMGFVTDQQYKKSNTTAITDLLPDTTYDYELIAIDTNGIQTALSQGTFKTLTAPDANAPANVSNLAASIEGDSIHLTWDNPQDADFAYVRAVRSYLFYPTDPYDGFVTYQDNGTGFFDAHALAHYETQYYTIFSYDTHGNVSSGAVIAVVLPGSTTPAATSSAATIPITATSSQPFSLHFSDLQFVQEGAEVDASHINALIPLTLRIPYAAMPEHLKTITVALNAPNRRGESGTYLLSINKDKTYYQSTIGPLVEAGTYGVKLTLFDFETHVLSSASGSLSAFALPTVLGTTRPHAPQWGFALALLLILLLLYILYRALEALDANHQYQKALRRSRIMISMLALLFIGAAGAYLASGFLHADSASQTGNALGAHVAPGAWPVYVLGFGALALCIWLVMRFRK